MKFTLIELVQDIMSDMDSDLVNSIDDTPESQQVAQIVKTTFYDIVSVGDWPHLKQLSQLNSATTAKPTHCKLPTRVKKLLDVRYDIQDVDDTRKKYRTLDYMHPDEFLDMIFTRKIDESNVQSVVDDSGVTLPIINDKAPQYWTTFDDEYVVFDSFDSGVDTFLQNSKTAIRIEREPTWTHDDTFIPDLPSETFTYLLAESKSRAFLALGQEPNEKAEQQSIRARRWNSFESRKAVGGVRYPNFGRRSKK